MAETFTFTIKPITDLSDVKANVGEIQKAFSKLKLPDKITGKLANEVTKFDKAYAAVEKKMTEGIKTNADASQLAKSQNLLLGSWTEIVKLVKEVSGYDMSKVVRFDTKNIKDAEAELAKLKKELNEINLSDAKSNRLSDAIKKVQGTSKSQTVQKYTQNMLDGLDEKQFDKVFDNFNLLKQHYQQFKNMFSGNMAKPMDDLGVAIQKTTGSTGDLTVRINDAQTKVNNLYNSAAQDMGKGLRNLEKEAEDSTDALGGLIKSQNDAADAQVHFNKTVSQLEGQVESYFGLNAVFRTVANMAREAMNTVKELDAAMTETAVVTNFSVGDMWGKLPLYTAEANKLGSSIKDVYEATTLYYQQGLNTTQSMGLAVETLKMARIAGMDAKDATDAMTAALRGFNLELNQASAQRINDVYSELAAITASDTQEISTAMEKVASLAHNAGMEVETTSAFLAQMIETTREAPENLGTALKTVIARFQEMKQDPTKLIDSEGVMLDANKVDQALKSIGVNLMNANGEFRKLDDVFLEIASRWDTLTMGQQRYIATMAAGSRQQSRFIAMMSDYGRTMELVDAAYDSSGASQRQFEKTLESMNTKLNQLKNAYDQFIMGLMNQKFLKGVVDLGTDLLDLINKVIDRLSSWTGPLKDTTKMILTLLSTIGGLTAAKGLLKGGISLGVQWFSGKEAREKFDKEYLGKGEGTATFRIVPKLDRQTYDAEKARLIAETKKPILQHIEVDQALRKNNKIRRDLTDKEFMQGAKWSGYDSNTQKYYTFDEVPKKIVKTSVAVNNLGASFQNAGFALQSFGNLLQNTPLAPFGKAVSVAGTAVSSLGGVFGAVATEMATTGATLGAAIGTVVGPMLAVGAAVAALAGIGYILYQEFTREKREMEALAEAASVASDAYDNLKTASEELKNSIEEIRNSDSLFDGLVVGTTEWNLALVEANQQVLDLIKKYSILQKYVTTDANGRMSISEAGFKAVQDEQYKLLGQAQALDIYNNALYNTALTRQEQDKLLKEEGIQKTKAGTRRVHGKKETVSQTQADEKNYNALSEEGKQQWEGIEAKLKAEQDAATKQMMRAALSASGELNDTVLNLFSQTFDNAQKAFEGETDMSVMKQAYADFIGGVFDSATGKITDLSGEEVDIDNDAIQKMYPQIMAILKFQDQAPQVESAVKSLGKTFDSVFGVREGNNFINDLLNHNVEIDFSQLEDFRNMEVDEIVDILGESGNELAKIILQNENASAEDLANLLKENAENLKQIQAKTYKDAAVWYAKTVKKYNAEAASHSGKTLSKTVLEGLTVGGASAINKFMNDISQSFDTVTVSAMGENLFSNILGQAPDVQASIAELINGVDWTSAIERGNFYDQYKEGSKAYKELNSQQKKFITGQKKVDKSLDLTGRQFEELVESSDFLEILTEKWSDFTNESGKIDANGVREMAKECGTLSKVLNLAEFDANNLAAALNYFQETGSFDGINSATLAAIKEFNQLDKAVQEVHDSIEKFEPGANYEEGVEAYQDYASKLKENVEKGYYSTAETISYAKQLVGEDKWRKLVHSTGSREGAENVIIEDSPFLEETVQDTNYRILDSLARGVDITGDKITKKITDELTVEKLHDGTFKWDFGKMDLPELVNSFMQRLHVPEHIAKGLVTGLIGTDIGYEGDNATLDIQRNGRNNGILEYLKEIKQLNPSLGNGNTLVMSEASRDFMMNAAGYYDDPAFASKEEAIKAFYDDIINAQSDFNAKYGEELGFTIETINTFNSEADSLNDYLQAKYGKGEQNIQKGIDQLFGIDDSNSMADFDEALQQMQADGIEYSQALQLAIDKAKELDWKKVLFNGKELNISEVMDMASFNEVVEEAAEIDHWEDVGDTIADAIIKAFEDAGIIDKPEGSENEPVKPVVETLADGKTTQEIDLKINKNQLSQKLAEAKTEVEDLEAEIEKEKKYGADTTDLEHKLSTAKGKVAALNAELTVTQNKLDTLQNRQINIRYSTSGSAVPSNLPTSMTVAPKAKGQNNHIFSSGFYAGSAARGRYGTVGPKNKGGLTLTGEKGFEIAWLPSENRSMILGARGPQLTDLPKDAVIYTHEQSKKIVKQKSIPAGSHAGYQKPGPNTGGAIDVNIVSDKTSGSGSKGSSSSSEKDPKRTNWYKEEITRYNLNQSINKIAANIKKTTEEIDKILDKVGTKYSDIANNVAQEAKFIKQNIENQKALRNSFQSQLNLLDKGGRSLWIDIMDSAGESSQKSISTSQFVYKDKDGAYKVDKNKVLSYAASLGGDAETQKINAEAIFGAINSEVSNLTSGLISAEQAILDYEKQLEERIQKISDVFFAWENELTKIYDLTQRIADADTRRTRFASENGLLMAQIGAGYESAASAGRRLIQVQKQDTQLIKDRIKLTQEDIAAKREQLSRDVSSKDERENWQSIKQRNEEKKAQGKELTTKEIAQEKAAKDDYLAAKYANKYIKRTKQADGSYKFDFNEEKLERDRRSGKINEATYNAIKEGFDTMVASNEEYQQSISDGFDYLAEIYEQYGEYIKTMADLESDLINAYEKAAQKEVQKLESLNSSLTASFKKVIDQVKRNIDNRRRQEDNLKTEGDIAQKQQRLAMLRANTSGGNQVEAAQLEKEIGDAQTQYGRTLEDQMLSNMQQQADQAAQQRQEQIDLAKQQIEYNKETGIYAAQADKLLRDVKGNATQIQSVLDVTKDQTTGKWGDKVWKAEVQTKIADGITASAGITDLQTQLSNNSSAINTLADTLTNLNKNSTKTKKKTSKKNQSKKGTTQKEGPQKEKPEKGKPEKEEPEKNEPSLLKVTTSVKQQVAAALWRDAVGLGWGNGKTRHNRLASVFGPKNANAIQAIVNKGSNNQVPYKKGYDYETQKKKKYKKYLSGGLADSTGPAWLDGTTSKPELVLNAQDTKNFIALKDILSGVMHDISHISSSEITNAPTEININVNVDKVTSDYDVDKLAKRLKNDIVKDMNYRNVTQVRNFR